MVWLHIYVFDASRKHTSCRVADLLRINGGARMSKDRVSPNNPQG